MADRITFTRNHSDLSTENGFQFEFFCDRCGSGVRTRFRPSATGLVGGALQAAGGLLGGFFGGHGGMGVDLFHGGLRLGGGHLDAQIGGALLADAPLGVPATGLADPD